MKQHILLLALVAALVGLCSAQGNRKCAANGEYCQLHSECCSGSCLSFSYKCVPVPPGPNVGFTQVPAPIDTANRFDGDSDGTSITQKTCAKNGEYCQTHSECCSGSCLTFSYKCAPLNPPAPGTDPSSWPGASPVQQPPLAPPSSSIASSGGTTTGDLGNRVGEDQTGSTSAVNYITPPPKRCASLGEYCLTSSECCSGACLSTRYKCVTNPKVDVGGSPLPGSSSGSTGSNTGGIGNRFDGTTGGSTTQPKCAAVGEYCLTSAECCSRSCLSFSYKCVNNYDLSSQISQSAAPAAGGSSGAGSTFTANRFGSGEQQCTANGLYCFHSGECCSRACYKSFCATEVKLGVPESVLTNPSIAGAPYVQVNSVDELITRFGGVADSSASASANSHQIGLRQGGPQGGKQCVVVGGTCSRQEDCCSNRCHSYRRKCVT